MTIEQFNQAPENTNTGNLGNSSGIGSLNLEDMQHLNESEEALFQTRCPDGTVVFHENKNDGATLCGKVADSYGIEDIFGDLAIEESSSSDNLILASSTKRDNGKGNKLPDRDAMLDRLLS